jgi:hypothetical protein
VAGASDGNDHIAERFPGDDPVHRIIAVREAVIVAVTQFEPFPVFGDRGSEFLEVLHPVHLQGGLVRPEDRLIRVDENDALGQTGDDLLELPPVGSLPRDVTCHRLRLVHHPFLDRRIGLPDASAPAF